MPNVEQLAEQLQEVHVLTNSCYRDYAQVNARQLAQQLDAVAAPGVWPPVPQVSSVAAELS